MKTQFPRLAIIGCGAVVAHHLAPALRRIGWTPSVLADPTSAHTAAIAARLPKRGGGPHVTADWSTATDRFDAAIVAVPHALHGPIGTALARQGKHIFMEKPLATTTAEGREMIAAAEGSGTVLSVGLLRRYLHVTRWTKALLESGILGEIRHFEASEGFVFNWAISTDAMLRRDAAGGGVLMDTGAHTLDLLAWWFGDATWLRYRDDSQGGIEADCLLNLEFASGARGSLQLSRARDLRNTIRIEGSRGFVEVHLYKNEVLAGSPEALAFSHDGISPAQMPKQMFTELFDAELADFGASAAGGERRGVGAAEAIRSVGLIERCYAERQPLDHPWAAVEAPARPAAPPTLQPGRTVVVTGATGFIGGRLVERLVAEHGARVRCVVRSFAQATRLARLPVDIVRADLPDAAAIERAVEGADLVFHCAYDVRSPKQNTDGIRNLIDACTKHQVRRLVHVSSFSVYEPFPDGPLSEETRDGDRSWTYAKVKLELEHEVLEAARTRGFPGTVVQPANVYGPFCKPWTNAPAEMFLYGGVILPEPGDGICNCVYIDDLVDALLLAAERPEAIGERFLVSGPEPVTWATFFNRFAATLGTPPATFWPAERISKTNRSVMRDVRMVLSDPKKIMQIIVRWNPARRALQAGMDALPPVLRGLVIKYYFERGGRRVGDPTLPAQQVLALYCSKALVGNEKAARLLGYRPRYGFEAGMAPTMRYVEWAYGDLRRTLGVGEPERQAGPGLQPGDLANAS